MKILAGSVASSLILPLLLSGCTDPVAPALRGPELARLRLMPGTFSVTIRAIPADASLRFDPAVRFPVVVQSSAGERVELTLRPTECYSPEGKMYQCNDLLIVADDAHALGDRIEGLPGVITFINSDGSMVFITLIAGDAAGTIEAVRAWDGVSSVGFNWLGCFGEVTAPCRWNHLETSAALVTAGDSLPHDHWIRASTGDTLIAEYTQPNGDVLSDTVVVA